MAKKNKNEEVPQVQNIEPVDSLSDMQQRMRRKGGRQKGSQNKVTARIKEVISNLLTDYQESGLMGEDFLSLKPNERIAVAEKLSAYAIPKMQAVAVDLDTNNSKITIENQLKELSQDPEEK